jgi:hypothetical protein
MSSRDIIHLINQGKWEKLYKLTKGSNSSILRSELIKNNSKQMFLEKIPDDILLKFVHIDPTTILNIMLEFYQEKYSGLAEKLFHSHDFLKFSSEIISLFNASQIIKIINSIIPTRFIEDDSSSFLILRVALNQDHNYHNITPKIVRAHQPLTYIHLSNWLKETVKYRSNIFSACLSILKDILTFASTLDSATANILLIHAMNIYECISTEENKKILLPILETFQYSQVFKNTMCSIFLEGSRSNCNFIELLGYEHGYDLFFVPVVVEEISGLENSQNTLQSVASKILRSSNDFFNHRILQLKHFSHLKSHPL